MQKTKWVYTFLAVAVLAISTTAPLVKLADATAPVIACYRMLFATCLVEPYRLSRRPTDLSQAAFLA